MDHLALRKARAACGLDERQWATVLDLSVDQVRRMERDPRKVSAIAAPGRVVRLINAYLAGYRPPDWPAPEPNRARKRLTHRETTL